MAFRLPTFNLFCSIWRLNGVGGVYAAPDVTSRCNLSPGKRVLVSTAAAVTPMELLLPPRTDIRPIWNATVADCVEVPQGSKRFYQVVHVDDTARGFVNEYRLALITYLTSGNPTFFGPNSAVVPLP